MSFAFAEDEIGINMDAFGVLCPAVEKRSLLAATYSSTKWPGRAPKGAVLLRGFVGGPNNQAVMEKTDDEIRDIALSELRDILGINPNAKPLFSRFYRWTLGMPQYSMGHLDRVELIEERSKAISGPRARGRQLPRCRPAQLHRERRGRGDQGARRVGHRARRGQGRGEARVLTPC